MQLSNIPQDIAAMRGLSSADKHREREWVNATVRWCLERVSMTDVSIRVEFNARFTSRMGDARVMDYAKRTGRVRLSASALWRRATPVKRRNTVVHEVAHVLANLAAGAGVRVGHGYGWKTMMVRLGEEPTRCHSVNRDGLRRRRARSYQPVRLRPVARPAPVARPVSVPVGVVVSFRLQGVRGSASVVSVEHGRARLKVHGDHGQAFFGRYVTVDVASLSA